MKAKTGGGRDMNDPLLTRIEEAEQRLTDAEQALAAAIGELGAVPRVEKTISTRLIENALEEVRAARAKVSELRRSTGSGGVDPPR
jgi:hypothetical protein